MGGSDFPDSEQRTRRDDGGAPSAFPASISLETVTNCNARCPFCPLYGPRAEMTRPKGIMSMDLFEKAVWDIVPFRDQVRVVWLCFMGEPLLDRHFGARLALLAQAGLAAKVQILTNAQYLTLEKSEEILRAGVGYLVPGFDAATRELYETHRVGCDYGRVLGNLRGFLACRERLGGTTRVAINYVRTPANQHEAEAAYEMWAQLLTPGLDEFRDTTSKSWATPRLDASGRCIEHLGATQGGPLPCPMAEESMVVLTDGRIAACCWDYNGDLLPGLGSLHDRTLVEIWNGAPLRDFRERHARRDLATLPRCQECVLTRAPVEIETRGIPTRYGRVRSFATGSGAD